MWVIFSANEYFAAELLLSFKIGLAVGRVNIQLKLVLHPHFLGHLREDVGVHG